VGVTDGTGAPVVVDRGERRMWARHPALLELRQVPTTLAPVVAQGWSGGSRQARLARLLVGCTVEELDGDPQRRVDEVLASAAPSAARTDVVDATVVAGVLRRHDLVVSSDPDDLHVLAAAPHHHLDVDRPWPGRTSRPPPTARTSRPTAVPDLRFRGAVDGPVPCASGRRGSVRW
jgi:hypothetical protein